MLPTIRSDVWIFLTHSEQCKLGQVYALWCWRDSFPCEMGALQQLGAAQVALAVNKLSPNARRDAGSIPGLARSPGGGHGSPLQYSCLENLMNRGAWWATVCGVAKSRTWLKQLGTHAAARNMTQPRKLRPKEMKTCPRSRAWCFRRKGIQDSWLQEVNILPISKNVKWGL